jgi:hypothetical protein
MSDPTATRKSDVDPVFEDQLNTMQDQAQQEYIDHGTNGYDQTQTLMPDPKEWSGDLFDWDNMSKPFSRKKSNDNFIEAIKKVASPGVSGDAVITTTQVEYLAIMERTFRARHTNSFPRVMAHMLGRRRGHGDQEYGLFTKGLLQYVRGIVKQSSDK